MVVFIFGWGKTTEKDFGEVLPLNCSNCKNTVMYRLLRIRKWFTLFFIPIIPYRTKHYLMCPICSRGLELKGEKIDNAKKFHEITLQFSTNQITKVQYKKELTEYRKMVAQGTYRQVI